MNSRRVIFVLILIFASSGLNIGRLVQYQIIENGYWKAMAQGQQVVYSEVKGERGEIYAKDKDGKLYPLAINRSWELVFISPKEIWKEENPESYVKLLADSLNLDETFVSEKINKKGSSYELLKNKISPEESESLKKLSLPGVYLKIENSRYYPQGRLAAHVLGFVGGTGAGQYGIEGYYDEILKGEEMLQEGERSSAGHIIKKILGIKNGENLMLTIDYNVQFMAEKLLEEAAEKFSISGGTIIVGDPKTGEIIAMVSYPFFDPNEYSKTNVANFKNSAVQRTYEPGSTFKPITMAIAIEKGGVTPDTTYTDEGFIQIGGRIIRNYDQKTWGRISMTEVLEKSINTGAVFAERSVGHNIFMKYLEDFSFFQPTRITLQGEVFSENKSFKEGYEINFANASFGQGIEITPIQMFKAFSVLANGGKLINPYVVQNKKDISTEKQILSSKTSSQITSMMISVVEKGFATSAKIPGYYVAGKTGTAQVAWSSLGINKRGYSDTTVQSFVGFAPALDPSFLILVQLEGPAARDASTSTAPIFKELAQYTIDYYQIPPDKKDEYNK